MKCPECSKPFEPRRWDQVTCSRACNKALSNRAASRAGKLYALLYHWRRGPREEQWAALQAVTQQITVWAQEDADAGRPRPPLGVNLAGHVREIARRQRVARHNKGATPS